MVAKIAHIWRMLQFTASEGHITIAVIVAMPGYTVPAADAKTLASILADISFCTITSILAVISVDDEMAADENTVIENLSLDRLRMSGQSFCYLLK
jgi:pyruvate-formate lyase-activating enzyme